MVFKVAITTGADASGEVAESIRKAGIEVVQRDCKTEDEVIETAKDCDAALIWTWPLTTRRVMEGCPKLKAVSRHGVGVDSVDLAAATELGVMVCNTPGINTVEVAEHAVALLMALTRQVVSLHQGVVAGKWTGNIKELRARTAHMKRIAGSTVGIIGLGNIGRAFALRIRGFAPARVLAYDPYVFQTTADSFGVQMVDFDTLLRESDFITIHAPDTPETHHMVGREQFRKMKRTAYIVNTARGPLIEPNGLYEALTRGWIAGAGLDVTEPEPIPAESPLLTLDNVVFTPHFAGTSTVASAAGSQRWPDNVVRVLNGQPPHGLANPDVLGRIAVLKSQGHPRWAGVQ